MRAKHEDYAARMLANGGQIVPRPLGPMYRMPADAQEILHHVAAMHELRVRDVLTHTKLPYIVAARVDFMVELRCRGWSLTKIGRLFAMHHTTVMHHLRVRRQAADSATCGPAERYPCPDLSGAWAI